MGRVVYTETPVIDTMQILARLYISICMRIGREEVSNTDGCINICHRCPKVQGLVLRISEQQKQLLRNNMEGFFLTATFLGFPKTSGLCFN